MTNFQLAWAYSYFLILQLVFRTVGYSGADMRNLVNEAGIMSVSRLLKILSMCVSYLLFCALSRAASISCTINHCIFQSTSLCSVSNRAYLSYGSVEILKDTECRKLLLHFHLVD